MLSWKSKEIKKNYQSRALAKQRLMISYNFKTSLLKEEDADDYTCVAVNAGGVSEQNVSLTFDQPVILGNNQVRKIFTATLENLMNIGV